MVRHQFLDVLGDYLGVRNVVLTSLNPVSAELPGTIAYQSSKYECGPVVASDSVVVVMGAGSTIITATLGAFTSTNSVTVTVPPVTNSVPRLPEEQPAFGYPFAHDPSTMIFDGSRYYVFADGQGIDGIYSADMRNWNYTAPVFPGNPLLVDDESGALVHRIFFGRAGHRLLEPSILSLLRVLGVGND